MKMDSAPTNAQGAEYLYNRLKFVHKFDDTHALVDGKNKPKQIKETLAYARENEALNEFAIEMMLVSLLKNVSLSLEL
eukprot:SAG11_NODE_56_length_19295_cov_20.219675_16_plen_78_part_00